MNIEENKTKILSMLEGIKREGIKDLMQWLENSDFFTAPASSKFHLNCKGGLALHSLNVYRQMEFFDNHFKLGIPVNSIILVGLLHDINKVGQYKENRLKNGEISEAKPYVVEDEFPIGHGEKSVILAGRFISLTAQEAMMIRWHMGLFDKEFRTYQDKIEKCCPEAILFHMADWASSRFIDTKEAKK